VFFAYLRRSRAAAQEAALWIATSGQLKTAMASEQ